MKADDFIDLYYELYPEYSARDIVNYSLIHDLLEVAKERHRNDVKDKDFEQSWKPVKGKGLEKITEHLLREDLKKIGLQIRDINDKGIKKLTKINFFPYGEHNPDVDLAIYEKFSQRVIAILSIKTSLRERSTQTAYWCQKIRNNEQTKHIKMFFVTLDSDDDLRNNNPPKKQRAVIEKDIDSIYIVNRKEYCRDDYLYLNKESRIFMVEDLKDHLFHLINPLD